MENMNGYRILGPEEIIREGDEYWSDEECWNRIRHDVGQTAFYSGRYVRRKIESEEKMIKKCHMCGEKKEKITPKKPIEFYRCGLFDHTTQATCHCVRTIARTKIAECTYNDKCDFQKICKIMEVE